MRIGIDATCLPSALAGAGRYILGLVNGLAALGTDHEFYIFIKSSDRSLFRSIDQANMRFVDISCSTRPSRLLWELVQAPGVIRQYDLDVWHAPHYIMPMATDARVVVTFHDMAFFIFPELYPALKQWMFRWAVGRASRTADHIIATSRATRDETIRLLGLASDRITVVHHGIDSAFQPTDDTSRIAAVRDKYRMPEDYILTVGTTDRRKNLDTLVRAYRILVTRDDIPHALVIAGQRGNGQEELEREIEAAGLSDRIHLPGYVAEEDLPYLYNGARLFVAPSRYEGFGFPALEALACNTPVITSPIPSILETPTQADIVYEPHEPEAWYDRISIALGDFGTINRQIGDNATWTEMARQTVDVYEQTPVRKNGVAVQPVTDTAEPVSPLGQSACMDAVLQTITYADLFDYPLTEKEIHSGLIGFQASEDQVTASLQAHEISGRIVMKDGLYMLRERSSLSEKRPERASCAVDIYRKNLRLLRRLCTFPFVRMVSLSGAMAHENCTETSDIDLFMIVDERRLWSVYAALAIFARLFGKRDLLCMNYLIGRADYPIEARDFYTAHQIASLRPVYGWDHFRRFNAANTWVMHYLPQWNGHSNDGDRFSPIALSTTTSLIKRSMELVLRLPVFSPFEWLIRRLYGSRIIRKTREKSNSDILLEHDCIKLHTNDHSRRILDRFERRLADVTAQKERIPQGVMERTGIR